MIGGGHDLELLACSVVTLSNISHRISCSTIIAYQPSPAAALDSSSLSVECLLELFNRAEVAYDGRLERAFLDLTTALARWRKILPEKRMVDVTCNNARRHAVLRAACSVRTSTVELEGRLETNTFLHRVRLSE